VGVEDRLAGEREERLGGKLDALGLATAHPQATLGIQVADVAHAVPEAAAGTAAATALLGSGEKHHGAKMEPSMAPTKHTPKALDGPSSVDESEDTIMRRLRVIVDEFKREGPPPVGCMEG
jgi:hypothetical protein